VLKEQRQKRTKRGEKKRATEQKKEQTENKPKKPQAHESFHQNVRELAYCSRLQRAKVGNEFFILGWKRQELSTPIKTEQHHRVNHEQPMETPHQHVFKAGIPGKKNTCKPTIKKFQRVEKSH
jgi:cytoskeletal protein RodZ